MTIKVIHSGKHNQLTENVESYTSTTYPISGSGYLNTGLGNLISINARSFSDSNTAILPHFIANPDTINPYAIGERGQWRLFREFAYETNRNYSGITARNSGLFSARSLYTPATFVSDTCYISPYNYLAPNYSDPNWHITRAISKWSPFGKELEDIDAVGNYSTAVFGYNEQLPVVVAANAKQGQVFFDGFEDYHLLRLAGNLLDFAYSPLNTFSETSVTWLDPYNILNLTPSGAPQVVQGISHTGYYSLFTPSGSAYYTVTMPIDTNLYVGVLNHYNNYFSNDPLSPYIFTSKNEYSPFRLNAGGSYIFSCWVKKAGPVSITSSYSLSTDCGVLLPGVGVARMSPVSNIIDGWQQMEVSFTVPITATSPAIQLPANFYIDDMRVYPQSGSMKSYVYNANSSKLIATLDENNFANIYEYDQEGNLIRVKKETSKGIMTVSESRNGNTKLY